MLHLKVPNLDKGKGPRIVFDLESGIALAEGDKDNSITHVNFHGLNYVVDSNLDDTAKELGIQIGGSK